MVKELEAAPRAGFEPQTGRSPGLPGAGLLAESCHQGRPRGHAAGRRAYERISEGACARVRGAHGRVRERLGGLQKGTDPGSSTGACSWRDGRVPPPRSLTSRTKLCDGHYGAAAERGGPGAPHGPAPLSSSAFGSGHLGRWYRVQHRRTPSEDSPQRREGRFPRTVSRGDLVHPPLIVERRRKPRNGAVRAGHEM